MPGDDLLNGWKEIAKYLDVSIKTARRWERFDKLPILRPEGRVKGPVLARKTSLDAWLQGALKRVALDGNRLAGLGRSDKIIWTYEYPAPLRRFTPDEMEWRLQRVALSGGGGDTPGVLFTARLAGSGQPDTMYYFSSNGKLEWSLDAQPNVFDRNGSPFEKAWNFRHVLVTSRSSEPTIWAALANEAGWAGCILRIDSRGNASLKFLNAGYVEWLCHGESGRRNFLIVCGENNA